MSPLLSLLNSSRSTVASSLTPEVEVHWEWTYTTPALSARLLTDQDSVIGVEEGKRFKEGGEAYLSKTKPYCF